MWHVRSSADAHHRLRERIRCPSAATDAGRWRYILLLLPLLLIASLHQHSAMEQQQPQPPYKSQRVDLRSVRTK